MLAMKIITFFQLYIFSIKQKSFRAFQLMIIVAIHTSCSTQGIKKVHSSNPLLNKYKSMRSNSWNQYTGQIHPIPMKKKNHQPKVTSLSMKHLEKNPIFQQVTQIHCFKIRASESRCNAIKYLAMVNCGNITKETQIKKYSKCLDKNFK